MDFSKVTNIVIPEGRVTQIAEKKTGKLLWGNPIANGVTFTAVDSSSPVVILTDTSEGTQYRINNGAWLHYDTQTTIKGNKISQRCVGKTKANSIYWTTSDATGVQSTSGKFKLSGYLADLLDWKKRLKETITYEESCFNALAQNCTLLTDISGLIFPDTVSKNMYSNAFKGCTQLAYAKVTLPAKVLNYQCYRSMFSNCNILAEAAPTILAEDLSTNDCYGCFASMFEANSSLTEFKYTFPAKIPSYGCYHMFASSSLQSTPDLSKITGTVKSTDSHVFEGMFYSCQSLSKATLPAAFELQNGQSYLFYQMYESCTNITTSDNFPVMTGTATNTSHLYEEMFYECKALTQLPTMASYPTYSSGGAYRNFVKTFYACESLTSVPDNYLSFMTAAGTAEFESMFQNCTGITSIGKIFGSTAMLAHGQIGFQNMFNGCTSLASMPTETWLYEPQQSGSYHYSCDFSGMFYNCKALASVQGINIYSDDNGLANCTSMFYGCSKLTTATLNTTRIKYLASSIFQDMFNSCILLTKVTMNLSNVIGYMNGNNTMFKNMFALCKALKEIPFTIPTALTALGNNACESMFGTCLALTKIPANFFGNVTQLGTQCCMNMFSGCTALAEAPDDLILNITTLGSECYRYMFYSTALMHPTTIVATTTTTNCYYGMYQNCSKMYALKQLSGVYVYEWTVPDSNGGGTPYSNMFSSIGTESYSSSFTGTPSTNTTYYFKGAQYVRLKSKSGTAMTFNSASAASLEYSLDNNTYQTLTANTDVSCPNGVIYLRGSDYTAVGTSADTDVFTIKCTANDVEVSGTLAALLSYSKMSSIGTPSSAAFGALFRSQTAITNADGLYLGLNTVSDYTCRAMFANNASLLTVNPRMLMGVNTVNGASSFAYMFTNDTKLTSVLCLSKLTKLYYRTCDHMFSSCTSITSVPADLFSNLTECLCNDSMQYMFYGCSGITTSELTFPNLTYLSRGGCFNMFAECTRMTTVAEEMFPELITVGYASLGKMFYDCTSLTTTTKTPAKLTTYTAYDRSATTATTTTVASLLYTYMYWNCKKLQKVNFTTFIETTATVQMYEYMFGSCSSLETAPEIPLTTLADLCCRGMFQNCTSLTTPPSVLKATNINANAYYTMFYNCTSLRYTPHIYAQSLYGSYAMYAMFKGCTALKYLNFINEITVIYASALRETFYDCTSLEDIVPISPTATVSSSYALGSTYYNTNVSISATQTDEYNVEVLFPAIDSTTAYNFVFTYTKGTYTGSATGGVKYYRKPPTNIGVRIKSKAGTVFTVTTTGKSFNAYDNGAVQSGTISSTAYTATYGHVYINSNSNSACGTININSSTNDIIIEGPLHDLIDNSKANTVNEISNAFKDTFKGNTAIYDCSGLYTVSGSSSSKSYYEMFMNCSNMVKGPNILTTSSGDQGMYSMFSNCYSLKVPPRLYLTSINTQGCREMFSSCSGMKASTTQDTTYTYSWRLPTSGSVSIGTNGNIDMFYGVSGATKQPVSGTQMYFAA